MTANSGSMSGQPASKSSEPSARVYTRFLSFTRSFCVGNFGSGLRFKVFVGAMLPNRVVGLGFRLGARFHSTLGGYLGFKVFPNKRVGFGCKDLHKTRLGL